MNFTKNMMTNAITTMYRQNESLCKLIITIYETMELTRKVGIHYELGNMLKSLPQGSTLEEMKTAEIEWDENVENFVCKSTAVLNDMWNAAMSKNEIFMMAVIHGWMSMVKSYQDVLPFLKPYSDLSMFGE